MARNSSATRLTSDATTPDFPDRVVVSAYAFMRSQSIFGSFFGANYYGLEKPAKSMIGPSAEASGTPSIRAV